MRVLLLSQFFDPEPASKGLAFARGLAEGGNEVEVLTGFPNYPGGKVYPGHELSLYRREVVDGITIHRVPLYPSHDRNPFRRVANYASFALSAACVGPWVIKRPDVAFVFGQPAHHQSSRGVHAVALGRPVPVSN